MQISSQKQKFPVIPKNPLCRSTEGIPLHILRRTYTFDVLLDFFPCNRDVTAALHANHANVRAHAQNLHALLAARVLFLHFKDVTDTEFLDLHKNSFPIANPCHCKFLFSGLIVRLPLGGAPP